MRYFLFLRKIYNRAAWSLFFTYLGVVIIVILLQTSSNYATIQFAPYCASLVRFNGENVSLVTLTNKQTNKQKTRSNNQVQVDYLLFYVKYFFCSSNHTPG